MRNQSFFQFEKEYFDQVYQGNYWRRNPPYKYQSFLKRIRRFRREGSLLDIGCAYGLFLKMASEYFQCEGLDISKHAIAVARKNLPREIKLHAQSLEKMELGRKFEVVTCFDLLEHLENLDRAMRAIKRHLAPQGILVLTLPVYDGLMGKLVNLKDKDKTHLQRQSRYFWLEKVRQHGFKIELFEGIFRYFLMKRFYLNLVSGLIRHFSPAILIIARKERT